MLDAKSSLEDLVLDQELWMNPSLRSVYLATLEAISRHTSPRLLAQALLRVLAVSIHADSVFLLVWNSSQQETVCREFSSMLKDTADLELALESLAETPFSDRRETFQVEVPQDWKRKGISSAVAIPLCLTDKEGEIIFSSATHLAWSPQHDVLFASLGKLIADAFSDALVFVTQVKEQRSLQVKANHLNYLLEISRRIASTRDGDELVALLTELLVESLECDFVNLLIYGQIEAFTVDMGPFPIGEDGVYFEDLNAPENQKAYSVYSSGQWRVFDEQEIRHDSSYAAQHLKTLLMAPLVSTGPIPGVLIIGYRSERIFSAEQIQLVESMCVQVSIGAENVRAYVEILRLRNQLQREKLYLEDEIRRELRFDEIVGESKILMDVLSQVETVAATDSGVLLLGETGTGKELFARAIHSRSQRNHRTFVKLNCAAIPMGLLESELFGHEKGAFTGAITQRIGRFELAHQGTLFLDEIGDIPLELQPKLLRALQEHEFERLGSSRTIKVDVRVVAATHRDLEKMVAENLFRRDLYYRLNIFPLKIPALRERREDIPLLVKHFTQKFAQKMKKNILSIPKDDMAALCAWEWPGNVRELENIIERSVILTRGETLAVPVTELKQHSSFVPSSFEQAERDFILRMLETKKGKVGGKDGAAAALGIPRTTLLSKMKKLKIDVQSLRD